MSTTPVHQPEGAFSPPTQQHLYMGGFRIPHDVLKLIIKNVYLLPPNAKALAKVVPSCDIRLETGHDIQSVRLLRRVCKVLKNAVDACPELRSSIVVALPLHTPSAFEGSALSKKPWHTSLVTNFLRALDPLQHPEVRLLLDGGMESYAQGNATMITLGPLLERAASLHVHGFDRRKKFGRAIIFPNIRFTLPFLTSLSIDNCAFRQYGTCGSYSITPLVELLKRLLQLKYLTVSQIVAAADPRELPRTVHASAGHTTTVIPVLDTVSMPNMQEIKFVGDIFVVPELLLHMRTSHAIRVTVQPRKGSVKVTWRDVIPHSARIPSIQAICVWGAMPAELSFLAPLLPHIESLTLLRTNLTQAHWRELAQADFPLPKRLNIVRCNFAAKDLKLLYARALTAIFVDSPLSFLKVEDCSVKNGGKSDLLEWLKEHVEHFVWSDMRPVMDHTRAITTDTWPSDKPRREVTVGALTAEDFVEDGDGFVNWYDLHSEEEEEMPSATPPAESAASEDLTTDVQAAVKLVEGKQALDPFLKGEECTAREETEETNGTDETVEPG